MTPPDGVSRFAAAPSLPRDADGPVFAEPWQAQAFALTVRLHEAACFTWTEWADTLGDVLREVRARGEPNDGAGLSGTRERMSCHAGLDRIRGSTSLRLGEIPPSNDPGDIGRAEIILRCAGDLGHVLRIDPKSQHIELRGKMRDRFCFRPCLVSVDEIGPEMVVSYFIDHGCSPWLDVGWILSARRLGWPVAPISR